MTLLQTNKNREGLFICILVIYTLLTLVPGMGKWDLWLPDEVRYTEVAREMADKGSFLIPVLNDKTYSEKPPFFFWFIIVIAKIVGAFNQLPARWISILSLTGTVLAVYFIGRILFDQLSGLWAGLIFATSMHPFWFAHLGTMDGLFVFLITISIVSFYAAYCKALSAPLGYGIAALALGLSVLTKGPLGLLLTWGVLMGTLFWKDGKQGLKSKALWGTLLLCLVPLLLWLVPACIQGGEEYTRIILFKQNFGRAVSSWSHKKPLFFYLGVLPAGLAPWIIFMPIVFWAWVHVKRKNDLTEETNWKLPFCWFFIIFAILTLISGKRDKYLLPIYPAAAVLIARGLILADDIKKRKGEGGLLSISGYFLWAVILIISLSVFSLLLWSPETFLAGLQTSMHRWEDAYASLFSGHGRLATLGLSLLGIFCSLSGLFTIKKSSLQRGLIPYLVFNLGLALYLNYFLMPVANPTQTPRFFCQEIQKQLHKDSQAPEDARIALFRQDYSAGFNFYLKRNHIPLLNSWQDITQFYSPEYPCYLLVAEKYLVKLEQEMLEEELQLKRLLHKRVYRRDTWLVLITIK